MGFKEFVKNDLGKVKGMVKDFFSGLSSPFKSNSDECHGYLRRDHFSSISISNGEVYINGTKVSSGSNDGENVLRMASKEFSSRVKEDGNRFEIDGKSFACGSVHIEVIGDIEQLNIGACREITVTGSVKNIETQSGSVTVHGGVTGNIETASGDVDCGAVGGYVKTTSGDVEASTIHGGVSTVSGDITR